jgi:hypothetical protein
MGNDDLTSNRRAMYSTAREQTHCRTGGSRIEVDETDQREKGLIL